MFKRMFQGFCLACFVSVLFYVRTYQDLPASTRELIERGFEMVPLFIMSFILTWIVIGFFALIIMFVKTLNEERRVERLRRQGRAMSGHSVSQSRVQRIDAPSSLSFHKATNQ